MSSQKPKNFLIFSNNDDDKTYYVKKEKSLSHQAEDDETSSHETLNEKIKESNARRKILRKAQGIDENIIIIRKPDLDQYSC